VGLQVQEIRLGLPTKTGLAGRFAIAMYTVALF